MPTRCAASTAEFRDMLADMKCLPDNKEPRPVSADEWGAIQLYRVLVLSAV